MAMVDSFAFAVSIWLCFYETDGAGFEKVPSCPFANEWQQRQRKFQCETQDKVYVCLMDDSMDFHEGCMFEETIHSGTTGCPSITVRNGELLLSLPESFHKCPVENPDCPSYDHEEYKLSEIYKYPACIYKTDLPASTISTGSISTSTVRATKSTEFTYPNCTCINPVEEDDDLIKDAVIWSFVPIYVVSIIIVTVAILRYRRKFNRNNSENENIELADPTSCKKYMFENGENYERNHDDLAPFGNNSENENIEFDDPTSCKYDMFENGENYERNHDDLAPFVVTPESSSWLSLSPPNGRVTPYRIARTDIERMKNMPKSLVRWSSVCEKSTLPLLAALATSFERTRTVRIPDIYLKSNGRVTDLTVRVTEKQRIKRICNA